MTRSRSRPLLAAVTAGAVGRAIHHRSASRTNPTGAAAAVPAGARLTPAAAVMEELVALLDANGSVIGSAPRSIMRRDNLRYGVTGVLVRNSAGQIYVHRRTPSKDVYPHYFDFAAGGSITAGEDPYDAVVRELDEELGITGVDLVKLSEGDYADEFTSYRAYFYACVWDGPVHHQPEEVEWGTWMSPAELVACLDDPAWPVVPGTKALLSGYVR